MAKLIINGGKSLNGVIKLGGAKNSTLPLLAATLLCKGDTILHNCPQLSDVDTSLKILTRLGCKCKRENNTVTVNADNVNCCEIPDDLMREMRSSIVFMGAIVAKCRHAKLSSPGGCELGPRPIDLHLSSLRKMGIEINEGAGVLECNVPNDIFGAQIVLSFPSVGATENIMLTAVTAKGKTIICNAAREPEIIDLADFLKKAGANISGAGSSTIEINGVERLTGVEHTVIPDRIAATTYMSAVTVCNGDVLIKDVCYDHMQPMINSFVAAGCEIDRDTEYSIRIRATKRPEKTETLKTMPYPGFPTDAGPAIVAMETVANGTSVFIENIFENRFRYVDELRRLGADIEIIGRVAIIKGVKRLHGAAVMSTDLRGGAALVIAGLGAAGRTEISEIYHIDRGYEFIENTFSAVGADIKRV